MKHNWRKVFTLLSVFLLSVSVLAGCGGTGLNSGSDDQKVEKKSPKKLTIGVSISTLSNPAFISLRDEIKDYAKEKGTKIQISDAQNDTSKQNNDVEDFVQRKVDALIINPCDSAAIGTAVKDANEAGIPVVCVDRSSDKGKVLSTVATNNVETGKMAAKYLVDEVDKNAKVAEVQGIPGASTTRDRGKGFDDYADGKLDIVTKQAANFDRDKSLTVTENILQAHPDISAIFTHNGEEAVGASKAVSESGKDIKVIGIDGGDAEFKAIKNGTQTATIAQQWKKMGKLSLQAVYDHYADKKVKKNIYPPVKLITKDNVDSEMDK